MEKKKIFNGLSALLFVVSLVLWFILDAIVAEGLLGSVSYTFVQLTFGHATKSGSISIQQLDFSILNLLTPLLLLVGAALAAMRVVSKPKKKKKGNAKLFGFGIFIAGLAAAVLILVVKQLAMPTDIISLKDFKLTTAAIIIAVLSGVAGISGVAADII